MAHGRGKQFGARFDANFCAAKSLGVGRNATRRPIAK